MKIQGTLNYDVVQIGKWLPTIRRTSLPPSSEHSKNWLAKTIAKSAISPYNATISQSSFSSTTLKMQEANISERTVTNSQSVRPYFREDWRVQKVTAQSLSSITDNCTTDLSFKTSRRNK